MKLSGHLDTADKFALRGWAMDDDESIDQPEIEIIQLDRVVLVITPCFEYVSLRDARKLGPSSKQPIYSFRLFSPLDSGIKPDVKFSLRFRDTGAYLGAAKDRIIPTVAGAAEIAIDDIKKGRLTYVHYGQIDNGRISMSLWGSAPDLETVSRVVFGDAENLIKSISGNSVNPLLNLPRVDHNFEINAEEVLSAPGPLAAIGFPNLDDSDRIGTHDRVRSKGFLPKSIFSSEHLEFSLPDITNIRRVAGSIGQTTFLAGGATDFMKLNYLSRKFCNKNITEHARLVDWGVGCGRILRHFLETAPKLGIYDPKQVRIGLDIDLFNITWCNNHLPAELGQTSLLELSGFNLESESIDFLYGISIFTHLTEHHQHLWLSEIRRVLRPGGHAIVTIHGEAVYYSRFNNYFSVACIEKWGIFDASPDGALGEEMTSYYRGTFHSRRYIERQWGQYFEILDVIPSAMGSQDYIVLKRPK